MFRDGQAIVKIDSAQVNQSIYIYLYLSIQLSIYLFTYIQGVPKKTFSDILANTYGRETSRISTELGWLEVSNDMRLDYLRYLVDEKIGILGKILTLIERTITPLQVHAF